MKTCSNCERLRKAHHFDLYGHCQAYRITVRGDMDAEHCPGWTEREAVKLPERKDDDQLA